MSESSETGQNSIVFLGRESFRMQVVGGPDEGVGAIPTAFWEGPTARLVERRGTGRRSTDQRSDDRRGAPQIADAETPQPAAPAPARNLIIGISLLAFACGIALATAANRMAHTANLRLAQIERSQSSTSAVPAAIVVQPLAPPAAPVEPAPAPEPVAAAATEEPVVAPIAVAALKPRPAPHAAIAKAAPAPRTASARAVHPRRPAAATSPDPFEEVDGPAAPRTPRKWVDPFAE